MPVSDERLEAQPLLPDPHHGHDPSYDSEGPLPDIDDGFSSSSKGHLLHVGMFSRFQARKPSTIILLLAVMMFAITTSGMLIMIPLFRLMEDALCHVYYQKDPSEPIDERLCKVDGVQSELAYLGGWGAMLGSLVGMVAALPYGVLADRIGRKPTFVLSYCGIILSFSWGPALLFFAKAPNLWLIIIGCLFLLIGGGIPVAMNSLNAMAADVSTEGDKSTGFLYLSFGAVSGGLVGPVVSGILMETVGAWIPIVIVFAITPFIFALLVFIPETLPVKLKTPSDVVEEQSLLLVSIQKTKETAEELKVSFALLKNRNVLLAMVNFFIQPALFTAYASTLAQYVSKYFGWTLAQTSYRLSPPLGLLHLVILLSLPRISSALTSPSGRFRLTTFSKDLLLTKISLLFLISGALMEGFSQEIVLFLVGLTVGTFGSANGPMCRAVTTAYVEPHHTSRLYALISMLETSGAVIGGPVLAWLFNVGLSKGGIWKGLPWFYVSGLVSIAFVAMLFVQRPRDKEPPPGEEEGSGDFGYQSAEEQS
ncbi:general substrate transporter [Apodospora peruviana]|uniref:General substrate transporter n=1 Tax=Apodospora peruviana TaxID=516989 RepID=A0AAE0M8F4_9PEZI|nr:general substrate transporter [Apodospora peruviana]